MSESKLREYVLSTDHPRGRHKARVFKSALGIGAEDWGYLSDRILEALPNAAVVAVSSSTYGFLYEVPILLEGLNGETHEVITAWIVDQEDAAPRLTTAYVNIP